MTQWDLPTAREFFDATFCHKGAVSRLPITLYGQGSEAVPGTVFQFVVGYERRSERCTARMYCGLAHEIGGRFWSQEAQSLMRLTAQKHPALPRVLEATFRDDEGVGVLVSEATGRSIGHSQLAKLRSDPVVALRLFTLVADAVRVLHSNGLVHRDLWRGAIELIEDDEGSDEQKAQVRLFGFEMSAFVASLLDPSWHTSDAEKARLRAYAHDGGIARIAARPPESLNEEGGFDLGSVTYRSDVFALAVCGFEWFIGNLDEVVRVEVQHSHEAVRAVLVEEVKKARHLPIGLRNLFVDMLDHDPRSRPTSSHVVDSLARIHSDAAAFWDQNEYNKPMLLAMARQQMRQHLHIPEWKNLAASDEAQVDLLRNVIEKDLASSLLVHEPAGAAGYVLGGDRRGQADSQWVLIGKRAIYFCHEFYLKSTQEKVDWVLHIDYVVDRHQKSVRNIATKPLLRRILHVKVVGQGSPEVDPELSRGNHLSWSPLLDEVRFNSEPVSWYPAFKKAFDWWLKVRRAGLELNSYAARRSATQVKGGAHVLRLSLDEERDTKRIETDPVRHLLAGMGRGRPKFGDFFGSMRDRDLGEFVVWFGDSGGRPDTRSGRLGRARVSRRLSVHEVDVEIVDGFIPDGPIWLQPEQDAPDFVQVNRQDAAVQKLLSSDMLMQSLYEPRSFQGSMRAWDHVTPALKGRAPEVVKKILASFPFYALQGPPGTGKTTVLAHAIGALLRVRPGSRILISAQSHFALDELAERVISVLKKIPELNDGDDRILCLRVAGRYSSESVRKSMQEYFDAAHAQRRVKAIENLPKTLTKQIEWRSPQAKPLRELVDEWASTAGRAQWEIQDRIWRGANIVFATCGTCTEDVLGHSDEYDAFDWVVVEEAAKAWPAELVMPLVLGHKWTLVGDHLQLPPYGELETRQVLRAFQTSSRDDVKGLVEDSPEFRKSLELFRYLFEDMPGYTRVSDGQPRPVDTLNMQFRMNDDIRKIIADTYYSKISYVSDDDLVTGGPTHPFFAPAFLRDRSIVWIDTGRVESCRHEEPHWKNKGEAQVVAELVGALHPSPLNGKAKGVEQALAILSPYQQQNNLIRAELPSDYSGLVHTTDSFQGREADTVIVSMVRTNERPVDETLERIGHVGSPQRSNVLLSRAKHLLIIVGDFEHFSRTLGSTWRDVCAMLKKSKAVVPWSTEGERT